MYKLLPYIYSHNNNTTKYKHINLIQKTDTKNKNIKSSGNKNNPTQTS